MSSFEFDRKGKPPYLQLLVPWALCTEVMVALECEVQNHSREESPKTHSPGVEGLGLVPACLGAEPGGQSHPYCVA